MTTLLLVAAIGAGLAGVLLLAVASDERPISASWVKFGARDRCYNWALAMFVAAAVLSTMGVLRWGFA